MAKEISEEENATTFPVLLTPNSDICSALITRYSKSKLQQHRHLIAFASALKSILIQESLPLTPPAYFAAAITAFQTSDKSDIESFAAVSSFLSILLSVESLEIGKSKAKDAAGVVAEFLKGENGLGVGSVRSLVNCLGLLVLKVDLEDWSAVEGPLEVLLVYSVDKRPKVRKCAQVCAEKLFKALDSYVVTENGSEVVFSVYMKYMPESIQLKDSEKVQSKSENLDVFHMFNVVTAIVPNLTQKVKMKIMCNIYKLLGCSFWSCTRHILKLIELLLENLSAEDLVSESENILSALTMYISIDKNPMDTVIYASVLLKKGMKKLHDVQPSLWIKFLPPTFTSLAGYLNSDANTSKHAEVILKELINTHINHKDLSTRKSREYEDISEMKAIESICSLFDQMLGIHVTYAETLLAVISALFLTLGKSSYFLMKDILLKLSQKMKELKEESPYKNYLDACIGTAVIAMGPEKVLSLIPISLNKEKGTCSNTVLIPILKKYVIGASLKYYMEHIVPLANSVQNVNVKKPSKKKDMEVLFYKLWDLLPAFCRYPTDISMSFEDMSVLLIATLKERPSLHEVIAKAVQELVNGTKNSTNTNHVVDLPISFNSNDCNVESGNRLISYSKKSASKNLKALACSSMDLFQAFIDIFLDSPPEKHTFFKEAIGSLASILGSEKIKRYFLSVLGKCEHGSAMADIQEDDDEANIVETIKIKGSKSTRCLVLELASAIIEAADENLTNIIFSFIKSNISDTDEACHSKAYHTLSRIIEVHSLFCLARLDDLMDLFNSNILVDCDTLENRFSCFHYLLVHIIKRNNEDMNTKAFLILNEIIVTLKTKKESRKLAYNILLNISCTLKETQSTDGDSALQRLLNMVMGYLSSSSPHMISGAISALSLLIHNDTNICVTVPNLIQSVLTLLQHKSIEIIKAALGFIKVLVSSLNSRDLIKLLTDILNGILPWSAVSKHHFRSKVGIILEIVIRKCGSDAVGLLLPDKYKGFFRTIEEGRQRKKDEGLSISEKAPKSSDFVNEREHKRGRGNPSSKNLKTSNDIHKGKRKRQLRDISSINKKKDDVSRRKFAKTVPSNSVKPHIAHSIGRSKKRKYNDVHPNRRDKIAKSRPKKQRGE